MNAIEILGLSKTYRVGFWRTQAKVALEALHLTVGEGEVFGFLGPNGAGKSTTIKMLMGLIPPTSGSARILGMELNDPKMKAQIGFLPEQPYFYDYLTATELLRYYGRLSRIREAELAKRIARELKRAGLVDSAHLQLRKFSKGMLQRLGIAQAILHDPKLVVLDEPMSGLDPMGRREVRDLIEELKSAGKTIFFSTHILSDAEALCDRVAILHQGRLRGVGAIGDLAATTGAKVELTWKGSILPMKIRTLASEVHQPGDMTRAVVPQHHQDEAIDALRDAQLEIVSLAPIRASLEDYFLRQVQSAPKEEVRS